MDLKELNNVLANLDQAMGCLEETYIENEGEVTDETVQMEQEISGLQDLITKDGVDLLGGWLKAKEDRKKALKAERDYITRQIAAIDDTIEFIKTKVNEVMSVTGQEKVKGERGYSFTAFTATKTDVDKDVLKVLYAEKVEEAIRAARVPVYIGVTLTASPAKALEYGVVDGDEELFHTSEKPSVRFLKPRASKEA